MGVTPNYAFPYPELGDAPDVPADMLALADALDDEILRVDADIAAQATDMADVPFGHAGRTGGFQPISAANGAYVTLASQQLTHGMTFASNGLVVPKSGLYEIHIHCYATDSSAYQAKGGAVLNSTALPVPGYLVDVLIPKFNGLDYTGDATVKRSLTAGDTVRLHMLSVGQTWGTDGYNGSYLELTYLHQ